MGRGTLHTGPGRVKGASQKSGTVRWTLSDVRDRSGDPQGGPGQVGNPLGGPGRVGRPSWR